MTGSLLGLLIRTVLFTHPDGGEHMEASTPESLAFCAKDLKSFHLNVFHLRNLPKAHGLVSFLALLKEA